ncbi:MAG: TIM barrel protein [Pseudomonadota bacterium]
MNDACSRFRFSANTGFLWKERPFLERIELAACHGFDGVEFHDEAQRENKKAVKEKLVRSGIPVISINTRMGKTVGCAAIPDMQERARQEISETIELAETLEAVSIHVLSGRTNTEAAFDMFAENLLFALDRTNLTVLIEPISPKAMPDYFMNNLDLAIEIIAELDHPRLKVLFDCFHISHETSDLLSKFKSVADHVGHVQISSFPDRQEPEDGTINYSDLLPEMQNCGYSGWFGCEYNPAATTEAGLSWRNGF